MERWCYILKPNTKWYFYECCQAWNKPDDPNTYFRSLPKMGIGYHYNPYSLHRWKYECTNPDMETYNKYIECDNELEARKPNSANYFESRNLAPDAKILPAFKRMGLTVDAFRKIKNYNAMGLMEGFASGGLETMHETLIKCRAYEVFNRMTENTHVRQIRNDAYAIYTAWKICRRNHYDYKKNADEWFDLVNLLSKRGLDYHNPHYVCPTDLHGLHNHLLELEQRDEAIRRERERRDADERARERAREAMLSREEKNKEFIKRREKYFGIGICSDKGFTIVALKNIDEFEKEGEVMQHCVFRCGYYLKKDSLILSARDKNNNPIETLEVDLRDFRILQCYGKKDTHTPLHGAIVKTMNENMWQIKEIARGKRLAVAS